MCPNINSKAMTFESPNQQFWLLIIKTEGLVFFMYGEGCKDTILNLWVWFIDSGKYQSVTEPTCK